MINVCGLCLLTLGLTAGGGSFPFDSGDPDWLAGSSKGKVKKLKYHIIKLNKCFQKSIFSLKDSLTNDICLSQKLCNFLDR